MIVFSPKDGGWKKEEEEAEKEEEVEKEEDVKQSKNVALEQRMYNDLYERPTSPLLMSLAKKEQQANQNRRRPSSANAGAGAGAGRARKRTEMLQMLENKERRSRGSLVRRPSTAGVYRRAGPRTIFKQNEQYAQLKSDVVIGYIADTTDLQGRSEGGLLKKGGVDANTKAFDLLHRMTVKKNIESRSRRGTQVEI